MMTAAVPSLFRIASTTSSIGVLCRRRAIALQRITSCHSDFSRFVVSRQFHQSTTTRYAEEGDDKESKLSSSKVKQRRMAKASSKADQNQRLVTEEMKSAARDVAKSLGGNWTKTAEELLARLASHQEPPTPSEEKAQAEDAKPGQSMSLLSEMNVGKYFLQDKGKALMQDDQGDSYNRTDTVRAKRRPIVREEFKDLFGAARLGLFDAESVKAALPESEQAEAENEDLWHTVDTENVRRQTGSMPRNGFEEMAQWTRAGKMWQYPVDNEIDMHEERQYKFFDHIFLDKHLSDFPDQGPIRKFMELVVIGLGSNPWLTVPEKIGHIHWYADYFREKEDILVASIGEQGRMKEKTTANVH